MSYSFHEHTADIRMSVKGGTLEEFFQDAVLGMIEIMDPVKPKVALETTRAIALEAPDITALLIDFLNETLMWIQTKREAYTGVLFKSISENSLEAELKGYIAESFGKDVKAATYHEADVVEDSSGGWNATVIFDI